MATRDEIFAAIRNADAAGDSESVRKLGSFLQTMGAPSQQDLKKTNPGEYDPTSPEWQAKYGPTSGMSFLDKFNAGAGKAFSDLGQGIKQKLGLASQDDVQESRRLDAPLMASGAAKAGNIGANLAMLAPTALLPGANTVVGAGALSGVIGALQPAASTKEAILNPVLAAAGGAAGQKIANLAAGSQAFQEAQNAARVAQNAQKTAAAKSASEAGYVIPPEDIGQGGGVLTKLASGLGGKIKTAQVASQRNQPVTNDLARKALGLPEDIPLNGETLSALRQQAGQAYNAIKNTGTVAADEAYSKALSNIGDKYTAAAQAFPGAVKSEIPQMVNALDQPQFSADAAVEMTKILRSNADRAFATGDKGLGKASKEAADALEGMLERHLQANGAPDALKAFQDARQLIAKTYTVQKALNPSTGDVSAVALAKMLDKGKPLSDGLLTAAQAGQAFPKAAQALKEAPKAISPLDVGFAVSHALGGHALNLLSLGARPVARAALLSGRVQQGAISQAAVPAQANALARILAKEPVSLPMGVLGGNALAAYLSQQ